MRVWGRTIAGSIALGFSLVGAIATAQHPAAATTIAGQALHLAPEERVRIW